MTTEAQWRSPRSAGRWREQRSVWFCPANRRPDWRCEADGAGISAEVAAYAIEFYSRAGEVVVDPDCGAGVGLIEAVTRGRHAVGVTRDARWWRVARSALSEAKRAGAWPAACVVDASRGLTDAARSFGLSQRADLVQTRIRRRDLGPGPDLESGLRDQARLWKSLLQPGRHAVVVLGPWRLPDGTLIDVATAVFAAAMAAGLVPVDRCVAVTAETRGRRVVPRPSAAERRSMDRARAAGVPVALVAHETVVVLQAPLGDALVADRSVGHPEGKAA